MGDDIKDILGDDILGFTEQRGQERALDQIFKKRSRSSLAPPPPSKQPPKLKRRKTGLEREIAALQAQNQPQPQAAQEGPKGFELKEKRKAAVRAERWIWKGFINSARSDNQALHHWVKASDANREYQFASFNKQVHVLEYSAAQYNAFFQSHDWSPEETAYLMKMCKDFDLRFIVIRDRWEYPSTRSVEDLKDRFYFIQRKLLEESSAKYDDKSWKNNPLIKDPFNKEQEMNRKQQLERLFRRDARQVNEEEALLHQANGITQAFKKHAKELNRTLKIATKIAKGGEVKAARGRGRRGRGRNTESAGKPIALSAAAASAKGQKHTLQINEALHALDVTKPNSHNGKLTAKYNGLKNGLIIFFELMRLEAESLYQLQVLKEHKNLLLAEKQQRTGITNMEYLEPEPEDVAKIGQELESEFDAEEEEEEEEDATNKDSDEDEDQYGEYQEDEEDGEADEDDLDL